MRWSWSILLVWCSGALGCASAVPVDCPDGFIVTLEGADCEPAPDPVVTSTPQDLTCADLDCDDENPCTRDGCSKGVCDNAPLVEETECPFGESKGVCIEGECVCAEGNCGPYPCTEAGLRAALEDGGDAVIGCEEPTTVTLTGGTLNIEQDGSLDGLGNLTIDGVLESRVLEVYPPAVAELIGMDITGGQSPATEDGGGIRVRSGATLTVRSCRVFGNVASDDGGAISCGGTCVASVIDSELFANFANNRGGAVANSGEIAIIDSLVTANQCLNDGGGIYNTSDGVVTLERTTVSSNLANSLGGGIWTSGFLVTLRESAVVDNAALGGSGIRLWTGAEVRAFDSLIARNVAAESGGGITSFEGRVTLERTIVSENRANERGGGIDLETESTLQCTDCLFASNRAKHGGAVYGKTSTARFKRSAIIDNTASGFGGGVRTYTQSANEYDLVLENCTVSGNSAAENGGGIATRRSVRIALTHTTLANNSAPVGSAIQQDGGASAQIEHSVLYGSCSRSEDAPFVSHGHNRWLEQGLDSCTLGGAASDAALSVEEMDLGVLADNGGLTPTHRPGAASLLLDAIPAEECLVEVPDDQRGETREGVGACDVGSVEVQGD